MLQKLLELPLAEELKGHLLMPLLEATSLHNLMELLEATPLHNRLRHPGQAPSTMRQGKHRNRLASGSELLGSFLDGADL